jgi:alpha-mannosidase
MLKFSFPVNVFSPVATYETPYGFISRQVNGDEDPGQRWIDVSGTNNGTYAGLTVINDAKYGYSVKDNVMNLSVARSAVYAHHIPRVLDMKAEHLWQDQGIQTFRMLLVPHKNSWQKSRIPGIAEEFMSQPVAIYQGIHRGSMPGSDSFLEMEPENVVVSAVKKAEGNEDLIIRCVETSGIPASANLNLSFIKRKWTGNFKPCEIKSLRVNTLTGEIKEVNLLEE